MQINTGPTRLRRFKPTDLEPFLAYRGDPEVARFQSWVPMDRAQTIAFLEHSQTVTPLIRHGHWVQVAVADSNSDDLLGDMGWHLSQDGREVELGITLARAAQGKGHATRAMKAACEHFARIKTVHRIVAFANLRNAPSRALLRRVGFQSLGEQVFEGVREEAFEIRVPRAQS